MFQLIRTLILGLVSVPTLLLAASCGTEPIKPVPDAGVKNPECPTAEPITIGAKKTSEGGLTFELADLKPIPPVQTSVSPGNVWKVQVTDTSGAPVKGWILEVKTFMPVHGHPGPGAWGLDNQDGQYVISDLFFGMIGQTDITFILSEKTRKEQVAYHICVEHKSG